MGIEGIRAHLAPGLRQTHPRVLTRGLQLIGQFCRALCLPGEHSEEHRLVGHHATPTTGGTDPVAIVGVVPDELKDQPVRGQVPG